MRIESSREHAPGRSVVAISIGFVVLFWALNFIAAKIGLRHLTPLTMASFRVVIAGIVMVPVYLACRRLPAFVEAAQAQGAGFTKGDLWTFAYLGFFGVIVNQLCFTIGLYYTLTLAVLFRVEKANWRKATGMAIAFSGILLLASEKGISVHSPSLLGDAITMTGSLGFAAYAVLGKRVAGRYDSLTMTAFNHFAGALLVLPLAIHEARALGPVANWRAIPWEAWASTLYMALFGSAAAYVLYFWLLRFLEASQLSAFTYLLPISATILGILGLGEHGSWSQFVGGTIALLGVYWIESGRGT